MKCEFMFHFYYYFYYILWNSSWFMLRKTTLTFRQSLFLSSEMCWQLKWHIEQKKSHRLNTEILSLIWQIFWDMAYHTYIYTSIYSSVGTVICIYCISSVFLCVSYSSLSLHCLTILVKLSELKPGKGWALGFHPQLMDDMSLGQRGWWILTVGPFSFILSSEDLWQIVHSHNSSIKPWTSFCTRP